MARVGLLHIAVPSASAPPPPPPPPPPSGSWPGQSGNLVGYANTPAATPAAFTNANGKVWPGAYSSLTAWPGGTGNLTISTGNFATSGSGTSTDPYVFAFYDFNAGAFDTVISVSNCIFVGCRFQSNDVNGGNSVNGGNNVTFIYCSTVPLVSKYTSPPGSAWPSAGAGANTFTQVTGTNCIDGNSGMQVGMGVLSGGPVTFDHCDGWGFGNSFSQWVTPLAGAITFTDCWIHDCCNAAPQTYHQDGLGYVNAGAAPSNITINHCTIASIGNTNGLAFQAASTPYQNISITNCYFSGFGFFGDFGHDIAGNKNWTVTDNTFGTDIQWVYGPLYSGASNFTNVATNLWRRNKLKVYPGSLPPSGASFTWTSANDGNYLWPDNTLSTTDWAK